MKFPKEFGDRSDLGLGALRSLHDVPGLPFAKVESGDTVTIKGNGFDTVTRKPDVAVRLGRYVTEGRFAATPGVSNPVLAQNMRAPFRTQPLAVVGGSAGALTIGVGRTILATDLDGSIINVYRTKTLQTKIFEATTNLTVPTGASQYYVFTGHAAHYKDLSDNVIEYETVTFSRIDGDNVLPKVIYSNDGVWSVASTLGYDFYDHFTYADAQLAPDVHLICHAPVRRGTLWSLGARAATPAGQVPYPLFQVSVDGGRNYNPVDLDYLFAGSTYQYAYPAVGGTVGTPGLGGYNVIFSIQWLALVDHLFCSLECQVDVPTAISINVGGINYEPRIFRSNGYDLTAMTSVAPPSGFGTVWIGRLTAAFANTQPGPNFGMIGYFATAVDQNTPNMLFVSLDNGASWLPPRFMPCIGRYGVYVSDLSTTELTLSVYEPTTPPQVVRYASRDFGLSWQRRQVIATNVITLGPTSRLNDFFSILGLTPDDGSLPTASPMNGWRYDTRLPKYILA
jgi:hypothetical protein